MANVKSTSVMDFKVTLTLSEKEAKALQAITEYGTDHFLKVFYEKMGKVALEPYEEGLVSLFETIKTELPKHIARIDKTVNFWVEPLKYKKQ